MSTTTTRTTPGGEMITTTETRRVSYRATSTGLNSDGVWVIGPVLVDVVFRSSVGSVRGNLTPNYWVEVDGRTQWGGVAAHITDDDGAVRTDQLAPPLLIWSER